MNNHYYILVDFKNYNPQKSSKKIDIFTFVTFFGVQSEYMNKEEMEKNVYALTE